MIVRTLYGYFKSWCRVRSAGRSSPESFIEPVFTGQIPHRTSPKTGTQEIRLPAVRLKFAHRPKEKGDVETIRGCTVVRPTEVEGILVLTSEQTGGAFTALVGEIPAGTPAPPLHEHPTTDEAFYVASGEVSFELAGEKIVARGGSLVVVPRGIVHTAWNAGADPVRGIIFITPGDVEHQFVEV